jgi:uncharacterized OsmC-like protein
MSSTPVEVHRTGEHRFTASNERGGEVHIGREGAPDAFTPGELLLAAIASCSALTSENLLIRRIGDSAKLTVHADRSKDPDNPHQFSSVQVTFDVDLGAIEDADERSKLVEAAERTIERFCTVSRTVEQGAPITLTLPR